MRLPIQSLMAVLGSVALLLLATQSAAVAQDDHPEKVVCLACAHVNGWDQSFCVNCGGPLEAAKASALRDLMRAPSDGPTLSGSTTKEKGMLSGEETPPAAPRRPPGITRILETQATNLPRLFNVPTAEVLGSLKLYSTGGGALGIEKERSLFGRIGLGLGDIADVEVASQSVINALTEGSSSLPTSAFKVRVLRERRTIPAVAVALRGTTNWHQLEGSTVDVAFETRLTKLYVVSSKHVRSVGLHGGVGLTDVRVRSPRGWTFDDPSDEELRRNLWAPFGGFLIRANPNAYFMGEIEGLPSYQFTAGAANDGEDIENVWVGVFGVRFYFTRWLVTDTGVRYRSDFVGIADTSIQANVTLLLDLAGARRTN